MNLEKDFLDFVELLNKRAVNYMVVGGYALAFHGEPRTTGDLDIWIDCTQDNANKMVVVMDEFGMGSLGFKEEDFMEPGIINQIGQPPLRIDILNEIDGLQFLDAVEGKQYFRSGNTNIPFIGKEEFIKNKIASGRKKDLDDVKKVQPKLHLKKSIKQSVNKSKRKK